MTTNKRQKIRKTIVIVMFLFFPVTITWLSPALPVIHALVGGVLTGAMIIFLLLFISSLFLGRAFCGYLCPAGGLQECMMRVSERKTSRRINIVKYIIWLIWIVVIIVFFALAGGINKIDFFAGTVDNWIFLSEPYRYMIYFVVVLLIAVLHLTVGKRAFCHSVCWIAPFMIFGTKLSDLLHIPRLCLKQNHDSCIGCKKCSEKCPMSLDVMTMVKTSNMKNTECILCGECIDICPKKCIAYSLKGLAYTRLEKEVKND